MIQMGLTVALSMDFALKMPSHDSRPTEILQIPKWGR